MTTARSLTQSKLFYFFFFAAAAALLPYVVLYYERLGLSGRQIGLLTSLPPLVSWISAPLWGGFSDATHQHKRVLLLAIAGVSLVVAIISRVTAFRWLIPLVASFARSSSFVNACLSCSHACCSLPHSTDMGDLSFSDF